SMTSCIGADGLADFDLAGHIPVITQEPGVTVGFYASQADAAVPQSPLPSPYHSAGGTIWVRLENADCFALAPLELIGATGPAIDTTPDALSVCDDNNDCFGVFDLTQAAADIWDSASIPAGVEFHYYLTPEDAEQQTQNFIAVPTAYPNNVPCNQTIYVSVTAPGSTCPSVAPLQLIVVPRPVANDDVQPVEQCDGEDNDGLAYFNLADQALLDEILGGLDGTTHTVTYYATAADVPANPIPFNGWAAYQSATADIIAVVTHTASGCRDQVTVPLVVLALPGVADIPPYRLCDDDFDQFMSFDIAGYVSGFLVAGQTAAFYASESDALSGNAPLGSPYTNTVPGSQYIWIVVSQGGCSHLTGMDIVVDPKPVPHLLAPDDALLFSCDDNNDGFAPFNLEDIADAMQMGVPATQMVINFYLTEQDAVAGNLPIDQTIPYVNVTQWAQTLYVGANNPETPGNCRSVWPVTLTVIPGAIAAELSDLVECDDDQDGFTQFNLTEQEAAIIALQTGPAPYQIRYFESASDAAQGISPIGNITNYTNQTAFTQQIWYRVDVTGGCHDEDSFFIKVNVPFNLPATLGLFTQCADADGNQLIEWDLPVEVPVPGITSGYQVHYYHSYADALTDTDEIMDPAHYTNQGPVDDLGVMVEDLATGCKSYTMATIRVLPLPHPQQLQDDVLVMCEENGSDTATFDLTQFEDELANGDMGMAFTYHTSLADAESGTAAIPASDVAAYVSSGGTIYIRVEQHTLPDDTGAYCHTVVAITLQVDQQPDLAPGKFLTGCEVPAGTGQMSFDLNDIIAEMMPGQDTSGFTFVFSDAGGPISAADALDYTNQTNPQTITVDVTNTATGCTASQTFDLIVKPGATAAAYAFAAQCDDFGDLTDGIAEFDL
ncbi:hypothetical protein HUK80_17775, partial [Flavobacterium sp. MAH-1]|nr:hypothetical protein [Flavobacterium agri]NYA72780.1 hypothetical protein [Flavobacterium agri]